MRKSNLLFHRNSNADVPFKKTKKFIHSTLVSSLQACKQLTSTVQAFKNVPDNLYIYSPVSHLDAHVFRPDLTFKLLGCLNWKKSWIMAITNAIVISSITQTCMLFCPSFVYCLTVTYGHFDIRVTVLPSYCGIFLFLGSWKYLTSCYVGRLVGSAIFGVCRNMCQGEGARISTSLSHF